MKKVLLIVVLALAMAVGFASCGGGDRPGGGDAADSGAVAAKGAVTAADYIFSHKNESIGDAVADGKVLEALGVNDLGAYTTELKTDEKPYAITINFGELKEDKSDVAAKMKTRAPVILALIANADEVHWTIDGEKSGYTVSDWNAENGTDLKSYGDSAAGIGKLLNAVRLDIMVITAN